MLFKWVNSYGLVINVVKLILSVHEVEFLGCTRTEMHHQHRVHRHYIIFRNQ